MPARRGADCRATMRSHASVKQASRSFRSRAASTGTTIRRFEHLANQRERLETASPVMRPVVVLSGPDRRVLEGAWAGLRARGPGHAERLRLGGPRFLPRRRARLAHPAGIPRHASEASPPRRGRLTLWRSTSNPTTSSSSASGLAFLAIAWLPLLLRDLPLSLPILCVLFGFATFGLFAAATSRIPFFSRAPPSG